MRKGGGQPTQVRRRRLCVKSVRLPLSFGAFGGGYLPQDSSAGCVSHLHPVPPTSARGCTSAATSKPRISTSAMHALAVATLLAAALIPRPVPQPRHAQPRCTASVARTDAASDVSSRLTAAPALLDWVVAQGGAKPAVSVCAEPGRGLGLTTSRAIKQGECPQMRLNRNGSRGDQV